jgi:uncharacterized protein with ParB-like and HNH nuclease domain
MLLFTNNFKIFILREIIDITNIYTLSELATRQKINSAVTLTKNKAMAELNTENQQRLEFLQFNEQKLRILETVSKFSYDFESLRDNFKEILTLLRNI